MHIHETVLYSTDLDAAIVFYRDVVGLRPVSEMHGRGLAFRVTEHSVLLVFDPSKTVLPGAGVPMHGATGAGHVGFSVPVDSLDAWRTHLAGHAVQIEMDVTWPLGGRSIYVRDPAGNSVEFIAGRVWPD